MQFEGGDDGSVIVLFAEIDGFTMYAPHSSTVNVRLVPETVMTCVRPEHGASATVLSPVACTHSPETSPGVVTV